MQSIAWEALRGLWSPAEKANADINAGVRNVWNRFKNGELDQAEAQRLLLTYPETGRRASDRRNGTQRAGDRRVSLREAAVGTAAAPLPRARRSMALADGQGSSC